MAEAQLASDAVHSRLRADILEGRLAPGDAVPSERALAEDLGINRHAVREALKRLQQAGLIRISQGGSTRVLDWRRSGGLEVLLDLMNAPGEPPGELIRSVLEMRETIGVDAARKFALHGEESRRAEAGELAATAAASIEAGAPEALPTFIAFWESVVDGSANLAYRLALNSLNAALFAYPALAATLAPGDPAGLRNLGTAIADADGDAAESAARHLLAADVAAFT